MPSFHSVFPLCSNIIERSGSNDGGSIQRWETCDESHAASHHHAMAMVICFSQAVFQSGAASTEDHPLHILDVLPCPSLVGLLSSPLDIRRHLHWTAYALTCEHTNLCRCCEMELETSQARDILIAVLHCCRRRCYRCILPSTTA